jgi:hypothetical protein
LVATASVHPQLSGTRPLSPDDETRHRWPAPRLFEAGTDVLMTSDESNHGTQDGKNRAVH